MGLEGGTVGVITLVVSLFEQEERTAMTAAVMKQHCKSFMSIVFKFFGSMGIAQSKTEIELRLFVNHPQVVDLLLQMCVQQVVELSEQSKMPVL